MIRQAMLVNVVIGHSYNDTQAGAKGLIVWLTIVLLNSHDE